MPYNYTPAVLAALGGVLVVIGGVIGRETRGTTWPPSRPRTRRVAGRASELPAT